MSDIEVTQALKWLTGNSGTDHSISFGFYNETSNSLKVLSIIFSSTDRYGTGNISNITLNIQPGLSWKSSGGNGSNVTNNKIEIIFGEEANVKEEDMFGFGKLIDLYFKTPEQIEPTIFDIEYHLSDGSMKAITIKPPVSSSRQESGTSNIIIAGLIVAGVVGLAVIAFVFSKYRKKSPGAVPSAPPPV